MLQYQASGNALRKAALTVEQLAQSLRAELLLVEVVPALETATESSLALIAQAQLAHAMQRIRPINRVASVGRADDSALVFAEDAGTLAAALASGAGAILMPPSLRDAVPGDRLPTAPALLVVRQPRLEFARAARLLRPVEPPRGIHSTALIAIGATIGLRVSIGPHVVIEKGAVIGQGTELGAGAFVGGGAVIGSDCRIHPRVVIHPGVEVGDRVLVQAGAVLGSFGFGYVRDEATGEYLPFPQQGSLVIEDDVEIGANTTIDRGALDETRICRGVKIDNLVHVGHNVHVGANAVIAAQAGISGSSSIGSGAVLAGQVGIGDHAAVGHGVVLGGQGGVLPHKTLSGAGQLFWGTPAKPVKQYLRELATVTRLARRGSSKPGAGSPDADGSADASQNEDA